MIPDKLKQRLTKDRASTSITIRMPADVVESLKAIAPRKGFSGYQSLLKFYISEGLRKDEAVFLFGTTARLAEALERRGVKREVIEAAVRDINAA